jgi:hypothetical protein
MTEDPDRRKLVEIAAKLAHRRGQHEQHRAELERKAVAMHDSMGRTEGVVASMLDKDDRSGILGHRYHKTLITERRRIAACMERLRNARSDDG